MAKFSPTPPDELEERLDLVEALIVSGKSKLEIVKYICVEHNDQLAWNISSRQVRNYIQQAHKRMSDRATNVDRRMYHVRSIQRLDHIYNQAAEKSDLKEMRASTMDLVKLLRLDEPSAEMDWKQVATQAGINPDNFLQHILKQSAEMDERHADG